MLITRFSVLDGYRGIAALLVMAGHSGFRPLFPHYYLAVDLFFMMSGFVLVMAYEGRLSEGLSPWAFIRIRFVRLWPLYAMGTLFAAASLSPMPSPIRLGATTARELLFFPQFPNADLPDLQLMALNDPAWSLFYEILISILFCFVLWRIANIALLAIILLTSAALVTTIQLRGSLEFGFLASDYGIGFLRAAFPFAVGMWLGRARKAGRSLPLPALASIILPLAALAIFWIDTRDGTTAIVDSIAVLIVFPGLIIVGTSKRIGRLPGRICAALGTISYPVYVLQRGFFSLEHQIYASPVVRMHVSTLALWLSLNAVFLAACLLIGATFDRFARIAAGHRVTPIVSRP